MLAISRNILILFSAGLMLLVLACGVSTEDVKETPNGKNCTLSGGEVVEAGWSGKDTGSNFCNICTCREDFPSGLACTEMSCNAKVE
jgi:hypothetical protein